MPVVPQPDPLVLAFCRRYVTGFQVGTLMSLLLPFGLGYLALQIVALLLWRSGILGGLGLMYTPAAMVIAEVVNVGRRFGGQRVLTLRFE